MIKFAGLEFELYDERLLLTGIFGEQKNPDKSIKRFFNFVEVQIAGENHNTHGGAKQFMSSEWDKLKYISHDLNDNTLIIKQRSALIEVCTHFIAYNNTNAVRAHNVVTNISGREIVIESVSSFVFYGLGKHGTESCNDLYFYRFFNSWHSECQPRCNSFFDLGLFCGAHRCMKRISGCNTGSWSTKEELPQGIIEDREANTFTMFQIESSGSWYYEIGENFNQFYLHLSGPNEQFNSWSKKLNSGESFESIKVSICRGKSINQVIAEMTKYRRNIIRHCDGDKELPAIFNEYMHLSWDNPSLDTTKAIAPAVKKLGIDCYVIDAGWHNEEDDVHPYLGHWRESKKRFPLGIKHAIDFLHNNGLKAGLWLEIETVGYLCEEMLDYYGEDCFFTRNEKKVLDLGRYQLDFRSRKVREYIASVFEKLIDGYGVDYLKIDYNRCVGAGTQVGSGSLGDGLLEHNRAYACFIKEIMDKYPSVIIENCASGGQRMDYLTLSQHPLQSTSDQTDYRKYPYIAGNILSAVLPEQAAVWSYPVAAEWGPFTPLRTTEDYKKVARNLSKEIIVINMINSLLGRIHLASHVELLDEKKSALISEGIAYYKKSNAIRKTAIPYFPLGFADFNSAQVAAGLINGKRLYLAVWNLKGAKQVTIPFEIMTIKSAKVAYPKSMKTEFKTETNKLIINFTKAFQARFFEIDFE